jgi:uncharacterized protein
MKNMSVIALMMLASALCTASSAQSEDGPSFYCRYAKAPDEVAICQNPALASDDRRMSSAYFSLRRSAAESGMTDVLRELEATQRKWLAARRQCGRDDLCLHRAYAGRLLDFSSMRQAYEGPRADQPIAQPEAPLTMEQDRDRVIREGQAHCERWPDDQICHFND